MDEADAAADYQARLNESALAAHHRHTRVDHPLHTGARFCRDCRRLIDVQRLLAHPHATRCVVCQARSEANKT